MSAFEGPKIASGVSCPQNDIKNSPALLPFHKLSYRFASDELDAELIAILVNESYKVECQLDGPFYFRGPGPKITAEEIMLNLEDCNCSSRWVVLETDSATEDIVAAGRFLLNDAEKTAVVDVLCSVGDDENIRNRRYSALLQKVESSVWSLSCTSITLEVSSWRTDVQDILIGAGYSDIGGHLDCSKLADAYLKPTLILRYAKDFKSQKKNENVSTQGSAVVSNEKKENSTSKVVEKVEKTTSSADCENSASEVDINAATKSGDIPKPLPKKQKKAQKPSDGMDASNIMFANMMEFTEFESPPGANKVPGLEDLMSNLFKALRSENK